MSILRNFISVIITVSFLFLTACASVVKNPITADSLPASEAHVDQQNYLSKNYVIAPGNLLGIKFFHTPKLNEEVAVRPDGKISLQLIDEVMAAGLTPMQLSAKIKVGLP